MKIDSELELYCLKCFENNEKIEPTIGTTFVFGATSNYYKKFSHAGLLEIVKRGSGEHIKVRINKIFQTIKRYKFSSYVEVDIHPTVFVSLIKFQVSLNYNNLDTPSEEDIIYVG